MIQRALQLDSFGSDSGFRDIGYQSALNAAYRKGFEDGEADAQKSQLARLSQQLDTVADGLHADEAARANQMKAAIQSFHHALCAIVEELVPLYSREKLIEELTAELQRAASAGTDRRFTIRCNEALKDQIDTLLRERPQLSVTIETVAGQGLTTSIVSDSGRTTIDIDDHIAFIKTILKNRKEEAWHE